MRVRYFGDFTVRESPWIMAVIVKPAIRNIFIYVLCKEAVSSSGYKGPMIGPLNNNNKKANWKTAVVDKFGEIYRHISVWTEENRLLIWPWGRTDRCMQLATAASKDQELPFWTLRDSPQECFAGSSRKVRHKYVYLLLEYCPFCTCLPYWTASQPRST